MANEKFTDLPAALSANLTDIICAVQGFPPGTSVQQTLQQVINLGLTQIVLNNAGNPNGAVAGTRYQLLWDTTDTILYVCTTSGNAATAVWTPVIGQLTNGQLRIGSTGLPPVAATLTAGSGISITNGAGSITIASSGGGLTWTEVTTTPITIALNTGYIVNRGGGVTFNLPALMVQGGVFGIVGKSGTWVIQAGAGQTIGVGINSSSVGGSLTSANALDSGQWVNVTANTTWSSIGGPQTAGFIFA